MINELRHPPGVTRHQKTLKPGSRFIENNVDFLNPAENREIPSINMRWNLILGITLSAIGDYV